MAPGYESAAKAFEGESSVVFAELDGDKYGMIAAKYDIQVRMRHFLCATFFNLFFETSQTHQ
mgnify:CR=1 FL=1